LEGNIPAGKWRSCAIVFLIAADAVHFLVSEVDIGYIDSSQGHRMASHRRGLGPARLQNLADGVGFIILQVADPPEAIAICGRIPFLGGIVDFYLPAGEGQAGAAV